MRGQRPSWNEAEGRRLCLTIDHFGMQSTAELDGTLDKLTSMPDSVLAHPPDKQHRGLGRPRLAVQYSPLSP